MNFVKIVLVFLLVCIMQGSCHNFLNKHEINLDLPEEERWVDIFSKNKNLLRSNINSALSLIMDAIPGLKEMKPILLELASEIEVDLPMPGRGEMLGMAKALDMDVGIFVIENLLYDFTAFKQSPLLHKSKRGACTSIVAQDKSGTIWHARNLDYGAINEELSEVLKNITMEIDFMQNGKVVYTATTYAGLTGFYTAQKPYQYTITIDERNVGSGVENILIALLKKNVSFTSQLVRKTFETTTSFKEAVHMLSSVPTPAASYFIVGGIHPHEGAVITKNRLNNSDIWYLNQTKDKWFLVETNYDHWNPAPKSDDRRDVAMKAMREIGQQNINKENLFKVLSTEPVLNSATTYTTIMSARQPSVYQTWIRRKVSEDSKVLT